MQASEIPEFVEAVIVAGCDICAYGDEFYSIGDADLGPIAYAAAAPLLRAIVNKFGERDFLRKKIVAHLRGMGRYVDSPDIAHWSYSPNARGRHGGRSPPGDA
nr:hypothetical protein [Rhizobium sp. Leaf384]